jgi:hypothetical protein
VRSHKPREARIGLCGRMSVDHHDRKVSYGFRYFKIGNRDYSKLEQDLTK